MRSGKRDSSFLAFFSDPRAGALLIAITALVAWHNSYHAPFVFDDKKNVLDNPSIRSLLPLSNAFAAPPGTGTAGRPLVNFSLAVNYALSGLSPVSYHAFNLFIHVMSGIILLGLLRRAFGSERMAPALGGAAGGLALAAALCWTLHPLTTESVTYITQRAESLMGMFFLLCIYCAARGFGKRPVNLWHAVAVAAFALGAASKEVIVVAPLLALAWDVVFNGRRVSESLGSALPLYAGFLAAVAGLFALVAMGGTAGADPLDHGIGRFGYLVTQGGAILHYLRLSFFPAGLAFDYWDWDRSLNAAAFLKAALVGCLFLLSAWGLARRHPAGYAGAWFFLVLAPTSSVMPLKYAVCEHRMYVPLAAVTALSAAGLYWCATLIMSRLPEGAGKRAGRMGVVLSVLAVSCLGALTISRNNDYRSEMSLWADNLKKRPNNPKAHLNMAQALESAGDLDGAVAHYRAGLSIDDIREQSGALFNIGIIMAKTGRKDEAEKSYRGALEIRPAFPKAMVNLAALLSEGGRPDEAERLYDRAIQYDPSLVEAHFNYANLLVQKGLFGEAADHYREVTALAPQIEAARVNLAICEARMK